MDQEIHSETKSEALRLTSDKKFVDTFDFAVRRWSNGKLSSRPGYYAGRGPLTCDLNSAILQSIWEGISDDVGEEAARNFVLMVNSLGDMSATAFLVSFEHYFSNKFRWDDRKQRSADGIACNSYGDTLLLETEIAIRTALASVREPEVESWRSEAIKRPFLSAHGFHRYPCEINECEWRKPWHSR